VTFIPGALKRICSVLLLLVFGTLSIVAQQSNSTGPDNGPPVQERFNAFVQATSIGQYNGTFRSPYEGPLSFRSFPERGVSLTTTLFLGLRLHRDTAFYFNPEVAGGRGLSNVNGIANFPNGEMPRVASATPTPYIARAYITHDFDLRSEREDVESDANQLGGTRPIRRFSVTIGRFSIEDFFDLNRYTHDPRTQFMAWGVMYNGAWDYPADTRGYTWGMVDEFNTHDWSLRFGAVAEPRVANGGRFDRMVFRAQGLVFEAERRYSLGDHPGAVRLLSYGNHTNSGDYGRSVQIAEQSGTTPDITATHRIGTGKYGFGFNMEQEVAKDVGVFTRLGWNDGKTEDFAFTAIDRLASAGVSIKGTRWGRTEDTAATSFTASGISGVHALYLSRGGLDFLIGDGKLTYGPEYVWESYYDARLFRGFFAGFDLQRVVNPAFNQDRGPVWIPSIRLHLQYALKK
jgi:high affinity Mn2+ porin